MLGMRILDYTIGPIGRLVLIAGTTTRDPRSFRNGIHLPGGTEVEALFIEIPEAHMFKDEFAIFLSGNEDLDEPCERFERGGIQFIRSEHAAFPAQPTQRKPTRSISELASNGVSPARYLPTKRTGLMLEFARKVTGSKARG